MPQTPPSQQFDETRHRDQVNRSLDDAIEEAQRIGYVSAEEGRRRVDEVLKRIDQCVAAGLIRP